jgi:hypothetical protein
MQSLPNDTEFVLSTEMASLATDYQQMTELSACSHSHCVESPASILTAGDFPDLSASSCVSKECATEFADCVHGSRWRTKGSTNASTDALLKESCSVTRPPCISTDFLFENKTDKDTNSLQETVLTCDKLTSVGQLSASSQSAESHLNKVLPRNTDLLIRTDKNGTVDVMAKRSQRESLPTESLSLQSINCLTDNVSPLNSSSITVRQNHSSVQPVIHKVKSRYRRLQTCHSKSSSSAGVREFQRKPSCIVPSLRMLEAGEASELDMKSAVDQTVDGKSRQNRKAKLIAQTEVFGKEVNKMKSDANVGRLALKRSAKTLGIAKFPSSHVLAEVQSKAKKAGFKKQFECKTAHDRNSNLCNALGAATNVAQQSSSLNLTSAAQMAHFRDDGANVQMSKSISHLLPGIADLVHKKDFGSAIEWARLSPVNGVEANCEHSPR